MKPRLRGGASKNFNLTLSRSPMGMSTVPVAGRSFFGHPWGIVPLSLTETWERFSFYGMRALLILYMIQHLKLADDSAFDVLGNYLSLVYLMPLLGGLIADRVTGHRKAVMIGLVLMMLGHMALAFDSEATPSALTEQILFAALALVAVGNGFMKPNISTLVGRLYEDGDARRDAGFSIFTMGVNLGALASALVCGTLAERFGWSYGFGAASIGMMIGLWTFVSARGSLPGDEVGRGPGRLPLWLWPAILALVTATWLLMRAHAIVAVLLAVAAAAVIGLLVYHAGRYGTKQQRGRMVVAFVLTGAAIILWFLNEQAAGSLNLLAERHVPREIYGLHIGAPVYQSLNPLFIIALAPVLGQLWVILGRRGGDLVAPTKFALGLVLVALGMAVLVVPCRLADSAAMISPWWLVLSYLLSAAGELLISPIGLSAITRLAMPGLVGTMMGLWFLGIAGGEFLAQEAGKLVSLGAPDVAASTLDGYWTLFALLTGVGIVAAGVIGLLRPWLGRLMGENHITARSSHSATPHPGT
jgi:POT family proton-dependent oligopeptide transporter